MLRRPRASLHVFRCLLLYGGLTLLLVSPALAGGRTWYGGGVGGGFGFFGMWDRPNLDGTGTAGAARFESTSFYVTQTGTYTFTHEAVFDRMLALYVPVFDSDVPLDGFVQAWEAIDTPVWQGQADLVAGNVYHLVTSTVVDELPVNEFLEIESYLAKIEGPGDVAINLCTFTDEAGLFPDNDDGEVIEATINDERFCVFADWADQNDNAGFGKVVPFRSRDSVLFSFFNPDNWELNVKVLDACGINGHYWVLLSGSTNVEFDVTVRGLGRDGVGGPFKTYSNELGELATAQIDIEAFPCP